MSPSAQQIQLDFIRLAGEEGSSLYWEQFLRNGTCEWPSQLRDRSPALNAWRGVTHLKDRLRQLAGATSEFEVLLANRSAQLMKLASKMLFHHCNNILLTDLTWPSYANILQSHQGASGCTLTRVNIRKRILRDRIGPEELISLLVHRYVKSGCDGLFIPAIDNLGVRLPVPQIVRAIRRQAPIQFVAIDAAQALGHIPLAQTLKVSNFLIAGCHKWMRASLPMGIGFFKEQQTPCPSDNSYHEILAKGLLDDPLLCFSAELEGKPASRFGETVNVAPMFSCQGAVNDALSGLGRMGYGHAVQLKNACVFKDLIDKRLWKTIWPNEAFRTGIVLVRQKRWRAQGISPESLRYWFHDRGISVTTYAGGMVRLSMPKRPWTEDEIGLLRRTMGPHRVTKLQDVPFVQAKQNGDTSNLRKLFERNDLRLDTLNPYESV